MICSVKPTPKLEDGKRGCLPQQILSKFRRNEHSAAHTNQAVLHEEKQNIYADIIVKNRDWRAKERNNKRKVKQMSRQIKGKERMR